MMMKRNFVNSSLRRIGMCLSWWLWGLSAMAQLPADRNATAETRALYNKINSLRTKGIAVGHQDAYDAVFSERLAKERRHYRTVLAARDTEHRVAVWTVLREKLTYP